MKVLIIFSWDDEGSQARYERMRQERRLKPYDFCQRFALPSPKSKLEVGGLFAMISTAIDSVNPDVLLIHTGAAYFRSPEAFAKCLLQIRAAYPILRLGFERHGDDTRDLQQLGVFEHSDEMHTIEGDFFD